MCVLWGVVGISSFTANLCCDIWQHYSWTLFLPSLLLVLLLIMIGISTLNFLNSMCLFVLAFVTATIGEGLTSSLYPSGWHVFSNQLGPTIGTVPWVVLLVWPFLIFLCFIGTEFLFFKIKRKAPLALKSLLDALWALSIDILVDPIQQFEKNWSWPDGGFFWGIPMINFVGWILIVGLTTYLFRLFLQKTKSTLKFNGIGYTLSTVFVVIYGFFLYSAFYWGLWQAAFVSMLILLIGLLISIVIIHPSKH